MAKQTKQTQQEESAVPSVSYSIEPYIAHVVDADGATSQVESGWMVIRESGGRREYCGEGLCWRPHPVIAVPFSTREVAETQVRFYAKQDAAKSAVIPIQTLIAEIPYCQIPATSHAAGSFMVRLAPDELWIVQAIRTALQRMNQENPGGTRIESDSAALRWILRLLAQACEPAVQPRESC